MATFAVVALAWMAAATALPNFHVADATPAGRLFFVGVVLLLLAGILAAQLAMLRTWFGARLAARPDRARAIAAERRATLVVIAICVGVGISVLWYATREWMPHVQRAVRGPGEPAAADDARAPGGGPP
jgi:hypothetical protein